MTVERSNETSLDAKLAPESFVADISFAARALLRQPTVAIIPVLLWSLPTITNAALAGGAERSVPCFLFVYLVGMLFSLGWMGAERIFFLRRLQKQSVTMGELLELATSFFGRFLALGLLFAFAFALWMSPLTMLCLVRRVDSRTHHLWLALFMAAMDFVLTFVPSALAFTTGSVRRALRIGFQMIRQTWPRCGLYVLCPPLALNFVNAIYPMHFTSVRLAVTAGLTVIGLLAKGATAAFYLRERPTHGPDGAAHITALDEAIDLLVRN
ncbi:MAG TPA: hypothetical protein VLC06_02845 [Polyangia bacterium]|nr:hypothetical protein [Polyangia bacterium]